MPRGPSGGEGMSVEPRQAGEGRTDRQMERLEGERSFQTLDEKALNPGPYQAVGLEVAPPLSPCPALQGLQTHASPVPDLTWLSLCLRSHKDMQSNEQTVHPISW